MLAGSPGGLRLDCIQGAQITAAPKPMPSAGNGGAILSSMISLAVSLLAAQPILIHSRCTARTYSNSFCVAVERRRDLDDSPGRHRSATFSAIGSIHSKRPRQELPGASVAGARPSAISRTLLEVSQSVGSGALDRASSAFPLYSGGEPAPELVDCQG